MPAARSQSGSAAAATAAMLLAATISTAAEPWAELQVRPQDMVGTLSCSAVSCHGGGGPRYWSGGIAGAEYVHWLGHAGTYSEGRRHYDPRAQLDSSDGDPHALAGQRISSARFQEVLQRASQRPDGSVDTAMYQRCAGCHDPHAIEKAEVLSTKYSVPDAAGAPSATRPAAAPTPTHRDRGITCETCHGGARQWIAVHYQRDISRERLLELGMVDTKNLFLRARLCAGCHVGSADNDMNHDMIAAGHPPLRFELASYEALIGTKHWDDRPQRRLEPEYEVQLWAAGRIASAEAALAVLEGRAKRAAAVATRQETGDRGQHAVPWPEFAESSCFACHQPLRSMAGQPSQSRSSGAVVWQSWNFSLLSSVLTGPAVEGNELPPAAPGPSLSRLRDAMERSIEPPPTEIAELAAAARAALRGSAKVDSHGRILDRNGHPLQIQSAVISAPSASESQNWDELCQQVAALAAARRAIADATGEQHAETERRLLAIARLLRFQRADREWPAGFADSTAAQSPATTMKRLSGDLEAIRAELLPATVHIGLHP